MEANVTYALQNPDHQFPAITDKAWASPGERYTPPIRDKFAGSRGPMNCRLLKEGKIKEFLYLSFFCFRLVLPRPIGISP